MRRFALTPALASVLLVTFAMWNTGCNSHRERVTEVRHTVLALTSAQLDVTGTNGDVEVTGEDRNDVDLEARVIAYAASRREAEQTERQVKIVTDGTIHDEGPRFSGWFSSGGYSVNYRLRVPRHLSAELHTVNGGVDIKHVEGVLHAKTTNGGLTLSGLAGDVHAHTVNGGVEVNLTGDSWHGAGLSVNSINGGISVTAPDHYSAHLVAQTVNGGISVDFPITVQGTLKNHLDTNLGQGGPTIRLQTVNGPISISR